ATTLISTLLFSSFYAAAPTALYTLSLHDALPIFDILYVQSGRLQVKTAVLSWNELWVEARHRCAGRLTGITIQESAGEPVHVWRSEEHTSELQSRENLVCRLLLEKKKTRPLNLGR